MHVANLHAVTIHWTGLMDWNTGLDYWTELFSFLDKFMCFFIERCLHTFHTQQVATYVAYYYG